jgi:hypothetical protein
MVIPTYNPKIDRTAIHEILQNDRRRATIEVLRDRLGQVSLRDLAETIAERETGQSPPPRNARESVHNSLHQFHLPKLDEQGVVTYDRDRKTIKLEENAREVYVHMELVTRYGITWADYYRSLGVLALMTVVAAELGVPGLAELEPLLLATVFLVVFGLSTARQLWVNRWIFLNSLLS